MSHRYRPVVGLLFALPAAITLAVSPQRDSDNRAEKDQTVTIFDKDNKKTVTVAKGALLVVKLAAQPGTGYGWQIVRHNADHLKPEGKPAFEGGAGLPGGTEYHVFRFKAAAGATSGLELHYKRPFDKDAPADKTFQVTIETPK